MLFKTRLLPARLSGVPPRRPFRRWPPALPQINVTPVVAVSVVDGLEVVEVGHHQGRVTESIRLLEQLPAAHEAQHQRCSRRKRGQRCKHVLSKSAISQQLFFGFCRFLRFPFSTKSRAGPRRPKPPAFGKAQVCPASDIQLTACSAGDPERYPSRPSPSR